MFNLFHAICFQIQYQFIVLKQTLTPPNIPGLQKLSPTSPRTKQTPRKNTNPIRTTSLSQATHTSSQTAVPQIDAKVTSPLVSNSPSTQKPVVASVMVASVSSIKPPSVNVVPPTPPKANLTAANVAATTVAPNTLKPVQLTPACNSSVASSKSSAVTPKTESIPAALIAASPKLEKSENLMNQIKSETPEKGKTTVEIVKVEKPTNSSTAAVTGTASKKQAESKNKPNASQNAPLSNNANQSVSKEKNNKEPTTSSAAKSTTDQVAKTPVPKAVKATPSTPIPAQGSAEIKVKRNRLKTIPYQSPTPEIELVSKISANEAMNAHKKKMQKVDEDKLTLFYK